MENINIELSSEEDVLFLNIPTDVDLLEYRFFPANLDERLTPEKLIEIWKKFHGCGYEIPLDRMVYHLYKDEFKPNLVLSGPVKFWQVLRMIYLLDKCSKLGKFHKFMEKGEQISKIKNLIKKMEKTEEEKDMKEKTIDLYGAILSVISELKIASILTEDKFEIEFIDKEGASTETGARPDIKFLKNGFTADLKYNFQYNFSFNSQDYISYNTMIKDLLITSKKNRRKKDIEKSDILIINCMDLYYQQIFSDILNKSEIPIESSGILPIKDAMERAFEIVNSGDKAIMLLFKGGTLSKEFQALVFPAIFFNSVEYKDPRRIYEVKDDT